MTTFSQNFLTQLSTDKQVWLWVKERLLAQMSKSINSEDGCMYKSDTGLKCAVGHLIDPVYYNPCIEGNAIYDESVQEFVRKSVPYWNINEDLLNKLQMIHDAREPYFWEDEFNLLQFDENDHFVNHRKKLDEQEEYATL